MKRFVWMMYSIIASLFVGMTIYTSMMKQQVTDDSSIDKGISNRTVIQGAADERAQEPAFNNQFTSVEQLSEAAEVIAVVTPIKQEFVSKATQTTVKVQRLIKGPKWKEMKIVEPAYVTGKSYWTLHGYKLMERQKSYIVFLRHRYNGNESRWLKREREQQIWRPISSIFAVFPQKSQWTPTTMGDEQPTWGKVRDFEIFTYSERYIETYKALRKDVQRRYGNTD